MTLSGSAPLVSVIIPAFNGERFIAEAIESALGQDYQPVEVIVVDDGSTDATAAIVGRYPVRYRHQANQGVGPARNEGIRLARGDLLAMLDQDDVWLPRKLTCQVEFLQRNDDLEMVTMDGDVFFEPNAAGHPRAIRGVADTQPAFSPSGWLFRRCLVERLGAFDPTVPSIPDFDLYLRMCERNEPVGHIHDPRLWRYRVHDRNAMGDRVAITRDFWRCLKRSVDRIAVEGSEVE